jgi:muramoyltetrapeptide carboxypeptidase
MEELQRGAGLLEKLGFKVEIGANIQAQNPSDRAGDINLFFRRPDIWAIVSAQGGDSSETLLPFIDWNLVAANPKIFMGFSDVTVLLNAIYSKTGLITFHGPDVGFTLGKYPFDYTCDELIERLCLGNSDLIRHTESASLHVIPACPESASISTSFADFPGPKTIRGGTAQGRLAGGNLRCLLKLASTAYWPDFTGAILMLESYWITGERCIEYLNELDKLGVFGIISGVIVGFVYSMQVEQPDGPQMEDLLLEVTKEYGFPILKVENFGHACPTTVLPIGCEVRLDADSCTVVISEDCLA